MVAIFFSILLSLFIPIFHIALIAFFKKEGLHIKLMFVAFLLYISIDIIIKLFYYYDSNELYLYLINSVSMSIFMSLFYMEAFSMVARGFSMRIITDIYLNSTLDSKGVMKEYAAGKGIKWMLKKRLEGIQSLGFISEKGGIIKISSKNAIYIAKFSLLYKSILKLGKGG